MTARIGLDLCFQRLGSGTCDEARRSKEPREWFWRAVVDFAAVCQPKATFGAEAPTNLPVLCKKRGQNCQKDLKFLPGWPLG